MWLSGTEAGCPFTQFSSALLSTPAVSDAFTWHYLVPSLEVFYPVHVYACSAQASLAVMSLAAEPYMLQFQL